MNEKIKDENGRAPKTKHESPEKMELKNVKRDFFY